MLSKRITGTTRVVGKSQGYIGLCIRDETFNSSVDDPDTPVMATAWEPTPKELEMLKVGGSIIIRICGTIHPPILVTVEVEDALRDEP